MLTFMLGEGPMLRERKLSLPDMMKADLLQQIIEHATDYYYYYRAREKRWIIPIQTEQQLSK